MTRQGLLLFFGCPTSCRLNGFLIWPAALNLLAIPLPTFARRAMMRHVLFRGCPTTCCLDWFSVWPFSCGALKML